MSYIDELRERFLAAEQRFGRIGEAGREYRERLMGLMSRIEEEIRCRRDVEQQQANEIKRLTGENEELRTMLMGLLQAIETGDSGSLDGTLSDMDMKVAALIGEGQGAPDPTLAEPPAEEPTAEDPPAEESPESEPPPPIFSVSEMMASPVGPASEPDDVVDLDLDEDPMAALPAEDDAGLALDDAPVAEDSAFDEIEEDMPAEDHAAAGPDLSTAPEPTEPADDLGTASTMGDFYGADEDAGDDILPAYAHPAGDWDDFLNEDMPAPATAASEAATAEPPAEAPAEPTPEAPAELAMDDAEDVVDNAAETAAETAEDTSPGTDDVAEPEGSVFDEDSDAPEGVTDPDDPGSIRELLDRVKSEIGGDDDQDLDDESDGDAAAAR